MNARPVPTPPFFCSSCKSGHAMLKIDAKLLRCAWCGHQSWIHDAIEAAREESLRRAAVWEGATA